MGRRIIGLLVAAALTVGACGTGGGTLEPPDEPDSPVLRIHYEGGFVPVETSLGMGPSFQLLSDGRLIFQGVTTMQYPGPLVVPYQQVQLSEADVDRVLALINEMGLADMVDERDDSQTNFVADAPTYVITYWDEEGEHKYSVYGLGIDSDSGNEATRLALELDTLMWELASGETETYVADEIIVFAGVSMTEPEPGFEDIRPWPLPDDPQGWRGFSGIDWKCNVYPGDSLDLFTDATQVTQWTAPTADAGPYTLVVRQLLPGEDGCPVLGSP
ncbi:MAG: hypothetical protein WD895_09070 [Acidimicrobiia bacterium]